MVIRERRMITIEQIPYSEARYSTHGDWVVDEFGNIHIRVSKELGEDGAFLVAIHELLEVYLCKKRGITTATVDAFDLTYEGDDPGADPKAPYFNEHKFATKIEKLLCKELGLDWDEYEAGLEKLVWAGDVKAS
jgi:hypothetical protein